MKRSLFLAPIMFVIFIFVPFKSLAQTKTQSPASSQDEELARIKAVRAAPLIKQQQNQKIFKARQDELEKKREEFKRRRDIITSKYQKEISDLSQEERNAFDEIMKRYDEIMKATAKSAK